jgi:hypothetical protein
MKKNRFMVLGALAMALAFGLVLSGCGKLPIATRKRLQDLGFKGSF